MKSTKHSADESVTICQSGGGMLDANWCDSVPVSYTSAAIIKKAKTRQSFLEGSALLCKHEQCLKKVLILATGFRNDPSGDAGKVWR